MRTFLWLTALFLLLGCTKNEPTIQKIDGNQISQSTLTAKIQALMDSARVTGMAVTIFNDNEITYQKAFGYANYEKRAPLRTDHVFYAASFSKAVFGYLVAQLALEGVIDLDQPLQDYLDKPLPEYEFEKDWRGFDDLKGDERYEQITARMCLSHTTGLPNWRWIPISPPGLDIPKDELAFWFDPGTRYSYSGEGMQLLQFVIEQITGRGLESLARERVFDPFGMEMTSYVWQKRFENRYCYGHTAKQEVIEKNRRDEAGAAGSMETTPEDYAKFFGAVLRNASKKDTATQLMFKPNVRIRSKAQFGPLAFQDTTAQDDIELGYGLGWGWLQTPHGYGAFKEGHDRGFQHYSIMFPEQQTGIVIFTNSDNGESIFKELLEISIGDRFTPWRWEGYWPWNHQPNQ